MILPLGALGHGTNVGEFAPFLGVTKNNVQRCYWTMNKKPFLCDIASMKRLFIVRHGKADSFGGTPDIERQLTNRGRSDATSLGHWTKEVRELGSPLLVSPAVRTRTTANLLCQTWEESVDNMTIDSNAYLASDRAWLSWINDWDDTWSSGWVVGHNPGLSELVERLTDQPLWLPTCGLAEVELQVDSWAEAFAGTGRLRGLFTPKSAMLP